jgi:hypothetical protein
MAAVGSARVEAVRFAYQYDGDVKVATASGATLMHAPVTGTANGATQEAQERKCSPNSFSRAGQSRSRRPSGDAA